ncbi:MAG TPA: hypothetical protein VLA24_12950 [Pseudomonadales bacterium]|nr:hypothetical protein [Pseudomonadales bacterium]
MQIQTITTYGLGGYDPTKPNNNIVEQYEVEIPDPEPTDIELLQAQIDALLILLAQEAT